MFKSTLFRLVGLAVGVTVLTVGTISADDKPRASGSKADDDALFKHLDSNADGVITRDDANANNRNLLDKVFQMSGQGENGQITPEQFSRIAEQHRRGAGRPAEGSKSPSRSTGNSKPGNRERAPSAAGENARRRPTVSRDRLEKLIEDFDRFDANSDRGLDADELQRALEELSEPNPNDEPVPPSRRSSARVSEPMPRSSSTDATRDATRDGSSSRNRERSTDGNAEGRGRNSLAGVWRGWVVDGRGENPNSGHMEIELTIDGKTITARELGNAPRAGGGESMGNGSYTMTGTGSEGQLDAVGNTGRYEGNEYLGIYEVEGDVLRWCVGNRNRPRPREFESARGNYLMILRRQK